MDFKSLPAVRKLCDMATKGGIPVAFSSYASEEAGADGYTIRQACCRAIEANGFDIIGTGAYGIAIGSPTLPDNYIVKLSVSLVDGFRTWVDYFCGPYGAKTPRVFHEDTICGVRIYVMERLKSVDWDVGRYQEFREAFRRGVDDYEGGCDPEDRTTREADPELESWFDFGYEVAQSAQDNDVRMDTHGQNWMVRPSTGELVINDPFAHNAWS